MSNLATVYANYVGVKLKPTPYKFISNYIGIPKKYITVFSGGATPSVVYEHLNKVIELITPYLGDIEIVQIGIPSDYQILSAKDYRGKSNFRQTAFIVENSLLHIGNDSVWNHFAGSVEVPFVCPCGPTPVQSITPYYYKDFSIVGCVKESEKPSYSAESKEINSIPPERLAEEVMKLLNIEWESPIKTIKIGRFYRVNQIDYIPNFPIGPELQGKRVAIRMDVHNNHQNLISFLSLYRGPVVVADPIHPDVLSNFKPNISEVIYFCDNNFNLKFIQLLHSSGIKYSLITDKTGEDLAALKLKLLDYNPPLSKSKPDLSNITPDCKFSSNRVYLGRGRFYPSLYHYNNKQDTSSANYHVADYINEPDFLEAFDNYYFYEDTK